MVAQDGIVYLGCFLEYIYILSEMTQLVLFRDRETHNCLYNFCDFFEDTREKVRC